MREIIACLYADENDPEERKKWWWWKKDGRIDGAISLRTWDGMGSKAY